MEEKDGGQEGEEEATWPDNKDGLNTKDEDQNEEVGVAHLTHKQDLLSHET